VDQFQNLVWPLNIDATQLSAEVARHQLDKRDILCMLEQTQIFLDLMLLLLVSLLRHFNNPNNQNELLF